MTTNSSIGAVGPLKLVTVNTAPERAKRIVGRLCEEIKDSYLIDYVANTTEIDGVRAMVEEHRPDVLFTASMWTPEEAQQIVSIARSVVPDLKIMSLPQGLQVEKGPDGVIEYGLAHLPEILGQ